MRASLERCQEFGLCFYSNWTYSLAGRTLFFLLRVFVLLCSERSSHSECGQGPLYSSCTHFLQTFPQYYNYERQFLGSVGGVGKLKIRALSAGYCTWLLYLGLMHTDERADTYESPFTQAVHDPTRPTNGWRSLSNVCVESAAVVSELIHHVQDNTRLPTSCACSALLFSLALVPIFSPTLTCHSVVLLPPIDAAGRELLRGTTGGKAWPAATSSSARRLGTLPRNEGGGGGVEEKAGQAPVMCSPLCSG